MGLTKKGRPRVYDRKKTMALICELVAQKQTLNQICKLPGMPGQEEVRKWMLADPDLAAEYARARELRADARADRIDEITNMVISGELDSQAARVVIDAEKWLAGKEMPKRYGDKIEQTLQNPDGSPISINVVFKGPDAS